MAKQPWYHPSKKFFGDFYYRGDHSEEGYIHNRPMTVRERTLREVNGLERLVLKGMAAPRMLDAPCGYGRHLVELRRRHYNVTGLDLCPRYLKIAEDLLQEARTSAQLDQGHLKQLSYPSESFDVVLNMFFAFGFYQSEGDNLRSLAEIARVLRPGGVFVFHTTAVKLAANSAVEGEESRSVRG